MNERVAVAFDEIADSLELTGDKPFRVYRSVCALELASVQRSGLRRQV